MQQYLFTKVIKCGLCGGTMRGNLERSKKKYLCSQNSNDNSVCVRNKIEESILIEHVQKYCLLKRVEFQPNRDFIRSIIEEVKVFENQNFEILYKDKSFGCLKDNCIKYV